VNNTLNQRPAVALLIQGIKPWPPGSANYIKASKRFFDQESRPWDKRIQAYKRRTDAMTDLRKLVTWADRLENENFHTLAYHARLRVAQLTSA